VTLAEALASAGYTTGHFGKWHLNRNYDYQPGRPMDPASQGFDEVLTSVKPTSDASPTSDPHHARKTTDAAIRFMEEHRSQPFFCYVAHHLVHRPVIGHPDLVRRYQAKADRARFHRNPEYAAMVHDLDSSVGRILSTVDELNLAENTLVIFASDNGAFLGDPQDNGSSCAPLRGGKGTNYEGGIRVPTIVRWPGTVASGELCEVPIITMDLFSTVLEAAGIERSEFGGEPVDGVSLLKLLREPTGGLDPRDLYWHYPHYHSLGATPHGAIRSGDWKLIEFYEDMRVELYNLAEDISESHDLAESMPDKAAALRDRLHHWRAAVQAQMPLSGPKSSNPPNRAR
jgi:arylsulfatase A-like enzyme